MAINNSPTRGALDDREYEAFAEIDGKMHKTALVRPDPDGDAFPVTFAASPYSTLNRFNSVSAVTAGVETDVTSYTVPVAKTAYLQRVHCGGENLATFRIMVNSTLVAMQRTWWATGLSTVFFFSGESNLGLRLNAGDVLRVTVEHSRPSVSDFESQATILESA